MQIDDYIHDVIQREGGYSDHPADKGGPTMYGITEAVARAFGYREDMRLMPRSIAEQIYRERYWIAPGFDKIDALSPLLAEELLDTGVNMGTGVAGRFLQRALNVLNRQAKTYPDLTVDGAIGKMTVYALEQFLKARGKTGEQALFKMLNGQQSVRYMEIAEANPSQEEFEFGWQANRVA